MSHVRFRFLRAGEIEDYLRRVHVLDKAGAYAAQEDPIGLIEGIEGSRTNVIGLPHGAPGPDAEAAGLLGTYHSFTCNDVDGPRFRRGKGQLPVSYDQWHPEITRVP